MIRRNYIETVAPMRQMDHRTVESKNKTTSKQQRYNRYNYKKDPQQLLMEEKSFMTSSNKKYHQYKDWKENKNKEDPKEPSRKKQPLNQFSDKESNIINRYKRDQECQIQQLFRKEYVTDKNPIGKARKSLDVDPLDYNYLRNNRKSQGENHPRRQSLNIQKFGHQKSVLDSPPRQRLNYQSTRKYSSNLQAQNLSKNYDEIDLVEQKPQKNIFTPSFDQFEPTNKNLRKQQTSIFDYPKKVAQKFKEDRQFLRENRSPKKQRYQSYKSERMPLRPSLEPRLWQQQSVVATSEDRGMDDRVSEKLKMISSFNDQINERIKNIIVCFEELKNKI